MGLSQILNTLADFVSLGNYRAKYVGKESKWYEEKIKEINSKYGLNLSDKTISWASENYGIAKGAEKFGTGGISISFNSSMGTWGNIANNIFNFGNSIASKIINDETLDRNISTIKLNSKTFLAQDQQSLKSKTLTQILMDDPFSIFANGSLYKQGAPGSKSYNPLIPYEPYKYITGDTKDNSYDDILMNRAHLKLAGNREYFSNLWADANWLTPDRSRKNKHLISYIQTRTKIFDAGFREINSLGWVANPLGADGNYRDVSELTVVKSDSFKELRKHFPKPFGISRYSNGG